MYINTERETVKLLMLSDHCCIRVIKQALALETAGHSVLHLCRRVANADMEPALSAVSKWRNRDELTTKLQAAGKAVDLIHVHNEPSELVTIARAACPLAPIVFDCHDLDACRGDMCNIEEHKAFAACDAAIFPSDEYADRAAWWFKHGRPSRRVYSLLTEAMQTQITTATHLGGLVYAGSTSYQQYSYTDYRGLANSLHESQVPFTVIQASNENTMEYVEAGAHVLGPLPYMAMLSELTRFDYGLCAGGRPGAQWNRTVPNKLWECVAAGIPVVCWQADATARIVEKLGIGEVLAGPESLTLATWAKLLARRETYRRNVETARTELSMDKQVPDIESLYAETITAARHRRYRVKPYRGKPAVSFVTGTLNRLPHLIAMMQSVRAFCTAPYEIVVVDGGSTDGTEAYCNEQPDVVVIQQGRRLGAVKAFNAGFQSASADIVVHLNDDCLIAGDPARLVKTFADNLELAQVAFPWKDTVGGLGIQRTPVVGLNNAAIPYANFGAVRKCAGDAVGWWGSESRHYAGDCELTLRLRAAGWETGTVDYVTVTHSRVDDDTREQRNDDLLPFKRRWFLRSVL